MPEFITSLDFAILHFLKNTFSCEFLDFLMPVVTALGNGGIVWILAAVALIITKKYRKFGFFLLAGLLVGLLIGNVCLKNLVARPRPCWIEDVCLLINNPTDFSFPSGHTLSSVIAAFILTKANRRFGFVAVPLAALIAFSRLYLYVHFPSDILASVILGLIIGALTVFLGEKIRKAFANRKARTCEQR